MANLPVRELVLYKHGVGFFIRSGQIDENVVALNFRHDEINDVLKSLAIFDRAGGQILGIHYQTPMDISTRLASSSVKLSENGSLRDLIRNLRGRMVSLTVRDEKADSKTITGRIVGLDDPMEHRYEVAASFQDLFIIILGEGGQVKSVRLDTFQEIRIEDEQISDDLTYFLDTSMTEDDRRIVHVQLSEGQHDLFVSYVAPSPTWRVSYRLVAESDESGETGKALLQGWGLFDNRLDEDLQDVKVTLVAGQPISFIYDLYASRIPQRPTVEDETRIAPGPIEYTGDAVYLLDDEPEYERAITMPQKLSKRQANYTADSLAFLEEPSRPSSSELRQAMSQSTDSAETKDSGEFFQYAVKTPVSVKRGDSALVPIINHEVNYQRELLYNGQKLPDHPVASLRFDNITGLTLERGPVTVVEDSDYKGEAIIPFTKDRHQVYIPYAVELGITVTEHTSEKTETIGLSIKDEYLIYDEYQIWAKTYLLENTTTQDQTITIEANINHELELFDTPAPQIETSKERRWQVTVKAKGQAEFIQKLRRRTQRYEQLSRLDYSRLSEFLKNRWLDQQTFKALQGFIDHVAEGERLKQHQKDLEVELQGLYKQQEELRKNMQALNPSGDEAAFRKRIVAQLEDRQNRVEGIQQEQIQVGQQLKTHQTRLSELIEGLTAQT